MGTTAYASAGGDATTQGWHCPICDTSHNEDRKECGNCSAWRCAHCKSVNPHDEKCKVCRPDGSKVNPRDDDEKAVEHPPGTWICGVKECGFVNTKEDATCQRPCQGHDGMITRGKGAGTCAGEREKAEKVYRRRRRLFHEPMRRK